MATECHHLIDRDPTEALRIACWDGHLVCVYTLMEAGADVNTCTDRGFTSLMFAASHGYSKCVEALLNVGANVNATDQDGNTALIKAAGGHKECVSLLIQAGADVNIPNQKNCTPVMSSAGRGDEESLHLLIEAGAHLDCRDSFSNNTALILAADAGHSACVKFLVEAGADVNIGGSHWNDSPLSIATRRNYKDIVELLIGSGADVNRTNDNGITALFWAAEEGHGKCIQTLLKAGAHIKMADKHGRNALFIHLASVRARREIAMLLFAAGETVSYDYLKMRKWLPWIPYIRNPESVKCSSLMEICRENIRKHLVEIKPPVNLFVKVPRLGLSAVETAYLLYEVSLDDVLEENPVVAPTKVVKKGKGLSS